MSYNGKFEFAEERQFRDRNTRIYRLAHWPIWIWVFFLAPGPLPSPCSPVASIGLIGLGWLLVLIGTGIAGLRGRLPGVEPCPYILRFDEDRPNPLYRRSLLHIRLECRAQLHVAQFDWTGAGIGHRRLAPEADLLLLLLAALRPYSAARNHGQAASLGPSTKGEGLERRYFYGSVWATTAAHTFLLLLWRVLPETRSGNLVKLIAFTGVLAAVGIAASRGQLPRTRPIVSGELIASD